MARAVRTVVCSGCIQDFPHNEMYTVRREMHRGHPEKGYYRTPYCAKCIKNDKEYYIDIVEKPKPKKKPKTKSKKDEKNNKKG